MDNPSIHIDEESTSQGGMIMFATPGKFSVAHFGSVADSQTYSIELDPFGLGLLPITNDG